MENEEPFIVTVQFKVILKKKNSKKKLSLPLEKYVCENFGSDH